MTSGLKVNLGCGPKRTQYDGYVNCDKDPELEPDMVLDVRETRDIRDDEGVALELSRILPWSSGTVEEVRCENLFDSLEKEVAVDVIREVWRVLQPGGKLIFHQGDVAKNPNMCFGWPFFKSPWTRYDFNYFTVGDDAYERWKVAWNLPGFIEVVIVHNDNGVMIGEMVKP
jgi:hypothetical protein